MTSVIKYFLLLFTFLILKNGNLLAQSDSSIAKNTLFVEGFGNGIYGSINYDRIFFIKNHKFSSRYGFMFVPIPVSGKNSKFPHHYTIPVEFNYLKGQKNHLEFGLGLTYTYAVFTNTTYQGKKEISKAIYAILKPIGYRLQKSSGGLFAKVNGLLVIKTIELNKNYVLSRNEARFAPFIGFSIGYTFKNRKS